ncbi:hypothetical protein Tco_1357086, partial [Tanacetum coccineum]
MTFINANVLSNFVSLQCLSSLLNALLQNTMAEQNVPAQPPTRTDEQIVPRSQWLTIGKSNLLYHEQKDQKEPHLQNQWTSGLGYPEPVEIVSSIRVNYVYQPWRAILSLLNQADMGRVYLRDPDIFLTQSKPQSQSEEPKEESNSSPHPLWTVFQSDNLLLGNKYQEDDDPDLELAKKLSLETPQEKGEGEGDDADLERAIKLSLDPAFLPQGRAPVGGVTIRDPVSETTSKLHEVVGKGKSVVTEEQVAHSLINLSKKKRTTDQFILVRRDQTPPDSITGPSSRPDDDTSEKAHEALAGPDPDPMNEDQTGSDSGKLHVSLAGPNPEHMDDEFISTAYPKVHENLKLITDERVINDKPKSHSGSMSSMKNL